MMSTKPATKTPWRQVLARRNAVSSRPGRPRADSIGIVDMVREPSSVSTRRRVRRVSAVSVRIRPPSRDGSPNHPYGTRFSGRRG